MFSNIFKKNYQNIGFEDVLYAIKNKDKFLLINTLSHNEQNILIYVQYHRQKKKNILIQ